MHSSLFSVYVKSLAYAPASGWLPVRIKSDSYFADCPRDDEGHCKPSGEGDEASAEKQEVEKFQLAETDVQATAIAKKLGAWVLPMKAADAAAAIASIVSSDEQRAKDREIWNQEPPSKEEVTKNWLKLFRSRKENESGKTAFQDLDPDNVRNVQNAINLNKTNAAYQKIVGQYGPDVVIFRQSEKGRMCAAEYRGVTHYYQHTLINKDVGSTPESITPGQGTAGSGGGIAAELRHEYAHGIFNKQPLDKQREWSSWLPDSDQVRSGITTYAARNHDETFCELFAIVTDPHYREDRFPPWVADLGKKLLKMIEK